MHEYAVTAGGGVEESSMARGYRAIRAHKSSAAFARLLARRLKALREEAGLSQQDVADRVGCTQAYISRLENGVGILSMSLDLLLDLASALETTLMPLLSPVEARVGSRCEPRVAPLPATPAAYGSRYGSMCDDPDALPDAYTALSQEGSGGCFDYGEVAG